MRLHHFPKLADSRRSGRFHNFYAAIDNRLGIASVIRRINRRQYGQINAKRLIRHGPATFNFFGQRTRRRLCQSS